MKSKELLSYFPLYRKAHYPNLIDSAQDLITEYSFDDAKIYYYRIFKLIPSSLYLDINNDDLENVLKFLKSEGMEYLLSTNATSSNEECINTFIIHDEKKLIMKIYWLNTDVDRYEPAEPLRAINEYDYPETQSGSKSTRSGELSIFFTFIPTVESLDFIERFRAILTIASDDADDYIHIFEKDSGGHLKLSPYKVKSFNLDVNKHYNEEFADVSENIVNWCGDFEKSNNKLVLLHGLPGTGKTNYIKHLMTKNKNIRKIYIPPYYVTAMTEPGFFAFIKNYTNSILIIEDAEKILLSRDSDSENSAMSVLLNLTDGILSDILNFKIIATFNVDKDKIDKALMRKGRMHLRYEFKNLSKKKTSELYQSLYNTAPVKDEMSIAEIFNHEENGDIKKEPERTIGFGT